VPAIPVELGPVHRQLGVAVIGDIDLGAGQRLSVGDEVELIDEGEHRYPGLVESVEPQRYGNEYRVRFSS
jgi:hypothetical protein